MALQDLCVHVIVENFERFYFAFYYTGDVCFIRKFEFLHRVYSLQVAHKLSASNMMQPNYIHLVVNKYLKVLDTSWFKGVPWETVVAKFTEIGPNIQEIKILLQDWDEGRPWKNIFRHLINLEVMHCRYKCNDEILKCVAEFCHNIVEIDVNHSSSITNLGIRYLCIKKNGKPLCSQLKKLSFTNSNVDLDGIKYLIENLRSLEALEATHNYSLAKALYSLHEKDLLALDMIEPYNLTMLNLNSVCLPAHYYSNLLKICFTLCPRLKWLSFKVLNEEHLNLASDRVFELEKLHVECVNTAVVDITNFVKLSGKKCTKLFLEECSLSFAILSKSCPLLKELILCSVISKDDDDIPSVFHHLESCYFENFMPDSEYVLYTAYVKTASLVLKYSPKLERITFCGYKFSSTDLKTAVLECCKRCPIKKVVIDDKNVDMDFVKDILITCHTLEHFKLNDFQLEKEVEEEMQTFAKVQSNCPNLIFSPYVDLSMNGLDSD